MVRLLSAGAVSLTSIGESLRGSDEASFVLLGHEISHAPFASADWTYALAHELQNFVFALQIWTLDSPEFALRVVQVGLSVAGLVLLAAAVYELAGPRAALICAWILALEPTNVFFSSLLHKEPNMLLATGLVAFGGALLWRRADPRSLPIMAGGCLIAAATRGYASWFLIAAAAAITLHTGLRSQQRGAARFTLVATVVLLIAVSAPTVIAATSNQGLHRLQVSQNVNTSDQSNLALEQVNFSTRGALITNLPRRVYDVVFRPYPWQLGSASQQIGVIGTTIAYMALALLISQALRNRGRIMAVGGPFVYLVAFLLVAYSLSAGNAGTAFRYRTNLLALGLGLLSALWLTRPGNLPERPPRTVGLPRRTRPSPMATP
jgi:hypothetical protein